MKKFIPFLALFFIACTSPKNSPSEPEKPSYIGLPIASYTIISTNQVLPSGDIPIGTVASFKSTYHRHQLIAGSSATLTLSGMTGIKIRSITLYMRSNKSSGAGSLKITNDQTTIWSINNATFNNSSWHGAYSTDTTSIFHHFASPVDCGDQLQIMVTATVNSLYIYRYDIEYEPDYKRPSKKDSALVSGLKTISILNNLYRLTGPLLDKYIQVKADSLPLDNEDIYNITFFSDTTATILHYATGTYVGWNKSNIDTSCSRWSVNFETDSTFTFYYVLGGRYYILSPDPDNDFAIHLISDTRLRLQYWKLSSIQ